MSRLFVNAALSSIQVMLCRDQLEIRNHGMLPLGWKVENLKKLCVSVPANPFLIEPLYLAGYIERMGKGTSDIAKKAGDKRLIEPIFVQYDDFRTFDYRENAERINHSNNSTDLSEKTNDYSDEMRKKFGLQALKSLGRLAQNAATLAEATKLNLTQKTIAKYSAKINY